MNTQHRDPLFESLDRLAGLADDDTRGERMPDIHRRVRQARRRHAAGLAAAVAVVAAGGVGIWQALPTDHKAEVVTTHASQQIALQAEDQGDGSLAIVFVVSGESTPYTDPRTGELMDYAGPRNTEVLVDGESVTGSDGGLISCEESDALTSYTMPFFSDEPYTVPVDPGRHVVVVKAPYCDNGTLVDSSARTVVTTAAGTTTTEELSADVDGDGQDDVISLVEQTLGNGNPGYTVELTMATSGAGTPPKELAAPGTIEKPIDLDGDGDLEIIVSFSGGEAYWAEVYTLEDGALVPIKVRDAFGGDGLSGAGVATTDWHLVFLPDGIYSWRYADPAAPERPASVEVRTWTLEGHTLTESTQSVQGCVDAQFALSLGAC